MNILNQPESPEEELYQRLFDLIEIYALALEVNATAALKLDPQLMSLPIECLATLYVNKEITVQECVLLLVTLVTSTQEEIPN